MGASVVLWNATNTLPLLDFYQWILFIQQSQVITMSNALRTRTTGIKRFMDHRIDYFSPFIQLLSSVLMEKNIIIVSQIFERESLLLIVSQSEKKARKEKKEIWISFPIRKCCFHQRQAP